MHDKNKTPHNEKGERHGLWEVYYYTEGPFWYRGHYFNGNKIGYWEWYYTGGGLFKNEYHAK